MARTQKQKATQTHAVSLVTLTNPSSPIAEQYRTIRTNIQFASAAGQQIKTIVVTSSGPEEGNRPLQQTLPLFLPNPVNGCC